MIFFQEVIKIIITSLIPIIISWLSQFIRSFKKHYIFKRHSSSIYSLAYPIFSMSTSIIMFILLYILALSFFPLYQNNIVSFLNNSNNFNACILIISILSNYFTYKMSFLKYNNIKEWVRIQYIFLPTMIFLIATLFTIHNFNIPIIISIVILYLYTIFIAIIFQPKIDTYVYHKMDLILNDGRCYKELPTENVTFDKDNCTISIFYKKYNPDIVMNVISIPKSSIISKQYYDVEYKKDNFYCKLLKRFPYAFKDSFLEKPDDN